jgi:hypothetical protein
MAYAHVVPPSLEIMQLEERPLVPDAGDRQYLLFPAEERAANSGAALAQRGTSQQEFQCPDGARPLRH